MTTRDSDDNSPTSFGLVSYAVTIQTLDRAEGNGITMVMVEADDPVAAEVIACRIAEERFDCMVVTDDAVPWPS